MGCNMLKKIFASVLIVTIIISLSIPPKQTEAFGIDTIVKFAAKKILKTVVKEEVIKSVETFGLKEVSKEVSEKYVKQEGMRLVQLGPRKKVMQLTMKQTLSSTEKKALGDEIENVIERSVNNGQTLSMWQKFLDFIVPYYTVAEIGSVITGVMSSDMTTFISLLAFQAMQNLGWLQGADPIDKSTGMSSDYGDVNNSNSGSYDEPVQNINQTREYVRKNYAIKDFIENMYFTPAKLDDLGVVYNVSFSKYPTSYSSDIRFINGGNGNLSGQDPITVGIIGDNNVPEFYFPNNPSKLSFLKNGQIVSKLDKNRYGDWISRYIPTSSLNIFSMDEVRRVLMFFNISEDGKYIWRYIVNTVNGNEFEAVATYLSKQVNYSNISSMSVEYPFRNLETLSTSVKIGVYSNPKYVPYTPYKPEFFDLQDEMKAKPNKFMNKEKTKITLPPLNSVPLKTTDGRTVVIKNVNNQPTPIDTTTNKPVDTTDIVDSGDIAVNDLPDGGTTVTLPADPTQPSQPSNVPVTTGDGEPVTPTNNPKTINWEKLKMAGDSFKMKFPFSIPWDLGRQFGVFNVKPQTPKFVIDFSKFPMASKDTKIEIDFHMFDPIAFVTRWFLTIAIDIAFILSIRRLLPQ